MTETKHIEDLLEAGEEILWEDRVREPGTRRDGLRVKELVFDLWGPMVVLPLLGLGGVLGSLELEGWRRAALMVFGFGFIASTFSFIYQVRKEQRFFRSAQLDYVLTNQRLIASNQTDQWTAQIFPGGLSGLARTGRNLELYLKEPDEPLTLYDLADVDAAEAIIAKTLGPLS